MSMGSILLCNLWDAVTETCWDAAAAADLVLAGVHFASNLADAGTQAWIFPAFSAILREGRQSHVVFLQALFQYWTSWGLVLFSLE